MQNKIFEYGKYRYEYALVREDRKTLTLIVGPDMSILLKAPQKATFEKIHAFLKRKWMWLEKQLRYFEQYQGQKYKKEYVSGESFLYLGRQYKLEVKKGKTEGVKLSKGLFKLITKKDVRDSNHNQKILQSWYEVRREKKIIERYKIVLGRFNYDFTPQLVIRKMKKRWGSYLVGKKVILNPDLIKASTRAIDYVITHELCHMKVKYHNSDFYSLLESKFSGWKKVKERLELRF